ncbi:outer membrane protein assembly factor BamB [Granulosicoccus sp. 3-233]|uniref:outer membrane protein assembly factor BamB n=1 Tax=Granulosicoccus sp. 3-233 TaxID=3417969 RepID=UPI003D353977
MKVLANKRLRLLACLAGMLAVAGCASEPPPVPPAELKATTAEVQPLRLWSAKVGEAGRGRFEPLVTEDHIVLANRRGRVTSLKRDGGMRQWRAELDTWLNSGVGGDDQHVYVNDVNGVVHALDAATGEALWQTAASSEILRPVSAGFGVVVVRSTDGRVVALEPEDGSERWSVSNTPPALTLNGYSQPRLLNGGVLVGLDDGRLLALNMSNGKLIWETVVSVPSGRSEVERLVDIDADIVLDDEGIYLANYQGKVARIEPGRGQIVWSVPMSAGAGIALQEDSLIVIDDKDTVHRLDKQSGQILWSNDTMPGRRLSPPTFTPAGDIVVGDVEGYVHVLDLNTGTLVGRTRLTDEPITARPIATDDAVIVQATDGLVAAFRFAR